MKKYITAAALLAAGTMLANAATVVLDSVYTADGESVSMWEAVVGKTSAQISAGELTVDCGFAHGTAFGHTLTLSSMYVSEGELSEGVQYGITSFSFIARPDNNYQPATGTVQIKVGDTVVATSGVIDYSNSGDSDVYGFATATFETPVVLSLDTAYTIAFTADTGMGEFRGTSASGATIDGANNTYQKVARIGLTAIPEPSAFGLLAGAGALALVAARRRRRAK